MRATLLFARTSCLRQSIPRSGIAHHGVRTFTWTRPRQQHSFFQNAKIFFRKPPPPVKGATVCLAALSPAAFIELSEEGDNGETGEERMLQASRQELAEYVPEGLRGSRKIRRSIWKFLDTYIIEPIATGFRFLHLVIIFVPVILTIPAIWIGQRQKDKDNERSGTLWWYRFLVRSMERAGAAFIKVSRLVPRRCEPSLIAIISWDNGLLLAPMSFLNRCVSPCLTCTQMPRLTPYG